jgi:hypothetical protein
MSIVNAYWLPPVLDVTQANHKFRDLGFRNDIPWPLPATVGAEYYGQGRNELPLEKQLNRTVQGEYFPRGGHVIPASGGVPLINPYSAAMNFERGAYTSDFIPPNAGLKRV